MHLPSLKAMRLFAKMHSNEILTGITISGIVAGNVLIAKAAREEAIDGDKRHYILPVFLSAGTIGMCVANGFLNKKQIESLSLLAAGSIGSLAKYQKNVQKVITPEQQESLDQLMIEADAADELNASDAEEKELFYLPQHQIIFWSTSEQVRTAELNLNQLFVHDMQASMADFLQFLDLESNANEEEKEQLKELEIASESIGWRFNMDDIDDGLQYITFEQYTKKLQNGVTCNYIYFQDDAQTWDAWDKEYGDIGL